MSEPAESSDAFAEHEASKPAPVTYDQASGRYGRTVTRGRITVTHEHATSALTCGGSGQGGSV